jgi:hypothetical protein
MHQIESVLLSDLKDLNDDYVLALLQHNRRHDSASLSFAKASQGKQILLDELHRSGIRQIDLATVQLLPTWDEVARLYYQHAPQNTCEPIIFGIEQCQAFAREHSTNEIFLATAGLYNTGTNALTYYLRANLHFPENPLWEGILVQVPWHKHFFIQKRTTHSIPYLSNITLSNVLPIVTIRDPLSWAQSMCEQPYDVEWTTTGKISPPRCPSLLNGDASVRIPKQTGSKLYRNLFTLWNEWYGSYLTAAANEGLSFVMVRHEDLLYCPRQVLSRLHACSGARWTSQADDGFVYVMEQAKWEHSRISGHVQSNRISAMIKHGYEKGRRLRHLTVGELQNNATGSLAFNQTLMNLFGYHLPLFR